MCQSLAQSPNLHTKSDTAIISKGTFPSGMTAFDGESVKLHPVTPGLNLQKSGQKPPGQNLQGLFSAHGASNSGSTTTSKLLGNINLNISTTGGSCGYGNGSMIVTATGGTPPYTYTYTYSGTYTWTQNTGNFQNLAGGPYVLIVTDATGSSTTTNIDLHNTYPAPRVDIASSTPPSSCTGSDGSITLVGGSGTPPYQYSINGVDFQTSPVFSNLSQGSYGIFVRDANGCVAGYSSFLILIVPNGNCYNRMSIHDFSDYSCNSNGIINLNTPFAGTPPYQYSLDGVNYQTQNYFGNLSSGYHTIYFKDATGLTNIFSIYMIAYCPLTINFLEVDASCQQNDGALTATVVNGTPPYTYTIDGINYQVTNTFSGLASGNYTVTVKDMSGATFSEKATVFNKCPTLTLSETDESCGQKNGTITAAGIKGTTPYQFSIDGMNFQNSNIFPGLASGNYTLTLKDANGFISTASTTINNNCLNATALAVPSVCGKSNGTVTVSVANGTAPYQYSLDGIIFQPANIFNNLIAGNYLIHVKDANGVMAATNITVTDIPGPQVNALAAAASCLNNDGTINVSASGGSLPFQYTMDGINFQNSNIFPGLDTGSKTIIVKDQNGCNASVQITVPLTSNLFVDAGNDITICEGQKAQLNAFSNGNLFSWSPSSDLTNSAKLNTMASPVKTTKYYLVSTAGICTNTDSVIVFVNPAPKPDAGQDESTCYGKTIQLQGVGGLSYLWSPDTNLDNPAISNPSVIKPTQTTTYYLTVTDANNCQSIQPAAVTITVVPPAKVFPGNDTSVIKYQSLQLNAIDVNNSGFSNFVWSPSSGLNNPNSPDPVAYITGDISYTVTASTTDGCEGVGSVSIKMYSVSDIYVPNAFTPNGDGRNDFLKAIPIGIKEFILFEVFNRWGQLVFSTKNAGQGWDGTIGGQPQQTGTYVWISEGIDFKGNHMQRRGSVILIR